MMSVMKGLIFLTSNTFSNYRKHKERITLQELSQARLKPYTSFRGHFRFAHVFQCHM